MDKYITVYSSFFDVPKVLNERDGMGYELLSFQISPNDNRYYEIVMIKKPK